MTRSVSVDSKMEQNNIYVGGGGNGMYAGNLEIIDINEI